MEQIPICINGIDYFVKVSFFEQFKVINEQLIGDTYFIQSNDFHISVHKKFYEIIKRDVKINKIFKKLI